jgi:hypothetical protein
MASISEIRSTGTSILVAPRGIFEPLNGPESLVEKLGRFGDHYDLSTNSHLARFLVALCGDAGAGAIKRELLYPKLQSMLETTHFTDLDRLYGDPLALPRINTEIYFIDPKSMAMTDAQWQDVLIKDAQYRSRCLIWMRAILEGPTPRGMALAAEAATGIECDVFERYQYLENISSDRPQSATNVGQMMSPNEFVILPRSDTLTEGDKRRVMRLVDRLRPVNAIFSIQIFDNPRIAQDITDVAASSTYFHVQRFVTGRPDTDWPAIDLTLGYWIERGVEKEAPRFAFFDRQESATFLAIANAIASSEHVGRFNPQQAQLFVHLQSDDTNHVFDESYSFAKAFAPIQLTSPWVRTQSEPLTLVNSFYPLGYFAENTISQLTADDPRNFWASLEKLPPETDSITYDFSTPRPINFIDFEICQKPIDFTIEHSLDGVVWEEFIQRDDAGAEEVLIRNPIAWDDFERANTSGGTIGTSTSLHTWQLNGTLASDIRITGGRINAPTGVGTVNASLSDLGETINRASAKISFVGTTGTATTTTIVISPNALNGAATSWTSAIFCSVWQNGWSIQLCDAGLTLTTLASGTFYGGAIPNDGTIYEWAITGDVSNPNRLILELPRTDAASSLTSIEIFDERLAERWGDNVVFRLNQADVNSFGRFEAVLTETDELRGGPLPFAGSSQGSVDYMASLDYPWHYSENHFNIVKARYVRLTFFRRETPFPFLNSEVFPWSIELRNLRMAHLITEIDDFLSDTGSDILGNTYRTDVESLGAENVWDNNPATFWQSQPNPVQDAVEALYFDLRNTVTPGTMGFLDAHDYVSGYDDRSMEDMKLFHEDGVVVDEIFIDPITFGPSLHVYYSTDDEPHWDNKLWTPIPRNYTLKKGYIALPSPVFARFIKLEFSNLTPTPYNAIDYPVSPEMTYRKFPTWVRIHFDVIWDNTQISASTFETPYDRIQFDPLVFGFQTVDDRLNTAYQDVRQPAPQETEDEIRTFIATITSTSTTGAEDVVQQIQENEIQFFGTTMWRSNLLDLLDSSRALSRYVEQSFISDESISLTAEVAPPALDAPDTQSVPDLTEVRLAKERPIMFFPRRCRHEYQIVRSTRPTKIAYFVAIRNVSFHRRDFTVQYDEPVYFESLSDNAHTTVNEFARVDWRQVVTP